MPNMVCAEYGAEYGAPNHPRKLPSFRSYHPFLRLSLPPPVSQGLHFVLNGINSPRVSLFRGSFLNSLKTFSEIACKIEIFNKGKKLKHVVE